MSPRGQDRREAVRRIRGGSEGKPKGGTKDGRRPARETGRGGGKVPDRRLCKSRLASLEPVGLRRVGVVRHGPHCGLQQIATGVAPRSTDGFGRTVTRGCVASGPASGRAARPTTIGPGTPSTPQGSSSIGAPLALELEGGVGKAEPGAHRAAAPAPRVPGPLRGSGGPRGRGGPRAPGSRSKGSRHAGRGPR